MSDTTQAIEHLVEEGELVDDLPGEWGINYWRPNGAVIELDDLGELLKQVVLSRNKRRDFVVRMEWWIGDLINYGIDRHSDEFYQLVDAVGYDAETCIGLSRVAAAFNPDRRRLPNEASVWDHGTVRTLKDEVADKMLERYADRLKPSSQHKGPEDPENRTILGTTDLRQEAKAQRMLGGAKDDSDPPPELHDCPCCLGYGKVTALAREQYLDVFN